MNKVKLPKLSFKYVNAPDSSLRVEMAYGRIFDLASRRLTPLLTQPPISDKSNYRK